MICLQIFLKNSSLLVLVKTNTQKTTKTRTKFTHIFQWWVDAANYLKTLHQLHKK